MASVKTPIFRFNIPPSARKAFAPLVKNRLIAMERRIVPRMKVAMLNFMDDVVAESLARTKLSQVTGDLAKSLYHGTKVTGSRLDTLAGVYRGASYATILEYGGVIRPVNARVLTIPLPDALRADGSPKFRSARSWKRFGTFSYTSKRTGQGYLVYKNKAGELVFLYMYVEKSVVRPKLGLRKAHSANMGDLMAAWGNIVATEMANLDIMSVLDNPDQPAKYLSAPVAASALRRLRPRISLSRRRRQ